MSNVAHALPANTTCRYHFAGLPGEVVWLTFRKFEVVHRKKDIYRVPGCVQQSRLSSQFAFSVFICPNC